MAGASGGSNPSSDTNGGWGFQEKRISCKWMGAIFISNRLVMPPNRQSIPMWTHQAASICGSRTNRSCRHCVTVWGSSPYKTNAQAAAESLSAQRGWPCRSSAGKIAPGKRTTREARRSRTQARSTSVPTTGSSAGRFSSTLPTFMDRFSHTHLSSSRAMRDGSMRTRARILPSVRSTLWYLEHKG